MPIYDVPRHAALEWVRSNAVESIGLPDLRAAVSLIYDEDIDAEAVLNSIVLKPLDVLNLDDADAGALDTASAVLVYYVFDGHDDLVAMDWTDRSLVFILFYTASYILMTDAADSDAYPWVSSAAAMLVMASIAMPDEYSDLASKVLHHVVTTTDCLTSEHERAFRLFGCVLQLLALMRYPAPVRLNSPKQVHTLAAVLSTLNSANPAPSPLVRQCISMLDLVIRADRRS